MVCPTLFKRTCVDLCSEKVASDKSFAQVMALACLPAMKAQFDVSFLFLAFANRP